MGQIVKKLKLKQADGTFTDYIPLGAEAKNVILNSGETVENKIANIENAFAKNSIYGDTAISLGRASGSQAGTNSSAIGLETFAYANYSHAEGQNTTAGGVAAHAEGWLTNATGTGSHAEGYGTIVTANYAHVQGTFNLRDSAGLYLDIVGNGTSNSARSNAYTLDKRGNAWFKGNIKIGGNNYEEGAELATKTDIENALVGIDSGITLLTLQLIESIE